MLQKSNFFIVAGMGWSGSSALIDWLYDQKMIIGFKNDYPSETKYIQNFYYEYLSNIFNDKKYIQINFYDISSILTGGMVGLQDAINSTELSKMFSQIKKNKNAIEILDKSWSMVLKSIFKEKKIITFKDFKSFMEFYKDLILKIIFKKNHITKKYVLFNNDSHLYNSDHIIDISSSINIVVYRNPLDQYVDQKSAKKIQGFCKTILFLLKFLLTNSIRTVKILTKKSIYLKIINFEKFVTDDSYRNNIFNQIFNEKPSIFNYSRFSPEKSVKNIFIHRKRLHFYERYIIIAVLFFPYFLIKKSRKNYQKI